MFIEVTVNVPESMINLLCKYEYEEYLISSYVMKDVNLVIGLILTYGIQYSLTGIKLVS
jgi:hypothetical protein